MPLHRAASSGNAMLGGRCFANYHRRGWLLLLERAPEVESEAEGRQRAREADTLAQCSTERKISEHGELNQTGTLLSGTRSEPKSESARRGRRRQQPGEAGERRSAG
jgi:hypothetical protein